MPTSPANFTAALRKGLGRAMILLREAPGDQEYGAVLLGACKVNQAFDPQCEEGRAPYLYRLIRETGQASTYRQVLVGWLSEKFADAESIDKVQIFQILCLMARDDHNLDRATLRDFLLNADFGSIGSNCIDDFVALEGIGGLVLCVRRFHAAFVDNDGDRHRMFQAMVDALTARDGAELATAALRNARLDCPELDALLSHDDNAAPPAPRTDQDKLDYAAVKLLADPKRGFPRGWVKSASVEELMQAADDLQAETDDRRLWRYLQVFGIRDFPRPPRDLFRFLDSPNRRVSWAATRALRRLEHPDIRHLALHMIAEGTKPALAIQLLMSNFRPGDLTSIEALIDTLTLDDQAWHDVGGAVLDLLHLADVPTAESRGILLKLYEEGPCSLCRYSIVSKLIKAGAIPDWMVNECRFDAERGTRETLADAAQRLAHLPGWAAEPGGVP